MQLPSLPRSRIGLVIPAVLVISCGGNDPSSTSIDTTTPRILPEVTIAETLGFNGRYADFTIDRSAGNFLVIPRTGQPTTVPSHIKRLKFTDRVVGLDIEGTAGQAYRLYQAAFDRKPDIGGLGVNINAMEAGNQTLEMVAGYFVISPEFTSRYGRLDNTAFVTQLYANVLDRAPDPGGLAFHVGNLNSGRYNRAQTLIHFSESPENKANVREAIAHGVIFQSTDSAPTPPPDNGTGATNPPSPDPTNPADQCKALEPQVRGSETSTGIENCRKFVEFIPQILPGTYRGSTSLDSASAVCSVTLTERGAILFQEAVGLSTATFHVQPSTNSAAPESQWNQLRRQKAPGAIADTLEEYTVQDHAGGMYGYIVWENGKTPGSYSAFGASSTNPQNKSFTCIGMNRDPATPAAATSP